MTADSARPGAKTRRRPVDAAVQERLGRKLKSVYDEVLSEPVPDRFLDLLAELEAQDSERK